MSDQIMRDLEDIKRYAGRIAQNDEERYGRTSTMVELVERLCDRVADEAAKPKIKLDGNLARTIIQSGIADDDLPLIQQSIRHRQEVIGAMRLNDLNPGDQFFISHDVRPRLLAGVRVEVVAFEGDKVKGIIKSWTGSPKWREGSQITLPKTLIGDTAQNKV